MNQFKMSNQKALKNLLQKMTRKLLPNLQQKVKANKK
jgi:hypothetical protein